MTDAPRPQPFVPRWPAPPARPSLDLGFGLAFADLYSEARLPAVDAAFLGWLRAGDATLATRLEQARQEPPTGHDEAELLLALAPQVEDFVGELFGIGAALGRLRERTDALEPLWRCKRLFVQRQAAKKIKPEAAAALDSAALEAALEARFGEPVTELAFARHVNAWLEQREQHAAALQQALEFAAWALHAPAGRERFADGVLFHMPAKTDPLHLVPTRRAAQAGTEVQILPAEQLRQRRGFGLTDPGHDQRQALDEANYCIWCEHQGRDSCSKGLREKSGAFRASPLGVTLAGCPLEERISEMNETFARGHSLGALAVAVVDNPMVAGTGHRICNDCMKACIYQKQVPVDIPQVETRALRNVLDLPWGFEVYSLLTRWNPLDLRRPWARPASGRRVLVAGSGPAGYTLAHHLLNDGHLVALVDGLKIEPLPPWLSGRDLDGRRAALEPVHDVSTLYEALDERIMAGFGGVAEYGITVRWDKNFLKVLRLLLERRTAFALLGGVRLGGTLDIDQAFARGFDHVALAMGAGRPRFIDMPGGLAPGVRQASDFLMALQLTGAARDSSLASLQVRLPIVVIGGGLTAIDTATEALAYYPVQVEKFLARYETLCAERGEATVRADWSPDEAALAAEFITHARALRAEREQAAAAGREPRLIELLQGWGGATIAYRRRLIDAPSYTLNHEEVEKALQEGIAFAELLAPEAVLTDATGQAEALRVRRQQVDEEGRISALDDVLELPARTVLVAAGTVPNTALHREDPHNLPLDGRYFEAVDLHGRRVEPQRLAKPEQPQVLCRLRDDGRGISFFGDLHPSYAGNVVKAMASAKQGYPVVSALLARNAPLARGDDETFLAALRDELQARVERIERLTPTIVEVVLRAPAAARRFEPGQFYRLQNFETFALRDGDTRLAMEGLALTGAWVDPQQGLISTIVLEMGGSSDLCALLRPGEPVVLMGPTGEATEIPAGETAVLVGGGLGNAVLFSIGKALRAAGTRVLYFAGYKQAQDRYKVADIEAAADVVVWACDQAPGFTPGRPQDRALTGNIVEAMRAYAAGELGAPDIALAEATRMVVIGSDRMMQAVARARHGVLAPWLGPHVAIGSINSPMQCMMKEICAQCLQIHRDPVTGETLPPVYSCAGQDQPLDRVDFDCLNARLRQNSLQEKLTRQWIDRALERLGLRPARYRSAA